MGQPSSTCTAPHLEDGSLVGLLVALRLGLVVVPLGEATGHVALGGGLHVQDDEEGGGDDDEKGGGDDAENVDIREGNLVQLLGGEGGGGGEEGGRGGGGGGGNLLLGGGGHNLGAGGGTGHDHSLKCVQSKKRVRRKERSKSVV
jgi:hypothetical protein